MTNFIVNNYLIIIIIGAFLIFALIGYAVDTTKNKKNKESELLTEPNDDANLDKIKEEPVEEVNEEINNEENQQASSETINMD